MGKIPEIEDLVLKKAREMLSRWTGEVRGRLDVGEAVARRRAGKWVGVGKGDWRRGTCALKSAGKLGGREGIKPSAPLTLPVTKDVGIKGAVEGFVNILQYNRWGESEVSEILDLVVPETLVKEGEEDEEILSGIVLNLHPYTLSSTAYSLLGKGGDFSALFTKSRYGYVKTVGRDGLKMESRVGAVTGLDVRGERGRGRVGEVTSMVVAFGYVEEQIGNLDAQSGKGGYKGGGRGEDYVKRLVDEVGEYWREEIGGEHVGGWEVGRIATWGR